MGRRDRQRVPAIVPVRVWGTNREGMPFSEHVCTVNISGTGVRLGGIRTPLSVGDIVGVQYRNRQARFRIVWTRENGTCWRKDMGLHCLQPEKDVWQTVLPEPTPDNFAVPEVRSRRRDRRSHPRFPVSGNVFVAIAGTRDSDGFQAKLGDISIGGCYVETGTPLPEGRTVNLLLKVGNDEISAAGVVRVYYAGVAMGIEFTHLNSVDQHTLERLISRLQAFETSPTLFDDRSAGERLRTSARSL